MKEKTKENLFWFMTGVLTMGLLFGLTIVLKIGAPNLIKILKLQIGI